MISELKLRIKESPIVKEMTPMLLFISIVASLGAMNEGYDTGWWSTFMSDQHALKDYNQPFYPETGKYVMKSTYKSIGTGLAATASCLGALATAPLSERYGRKSAVFAAAVFCIVGVLIECTTIHHFWGITIGRMVVSVSNGISHAVVPVYLAECSPSSIRGTLTGMYQLISTVGQFTAYLISFLTKDLESKWSYLTVIICQFAIPIIMSCTVPFLVESPRWLILRGNITQAEKNLIQIVGPQGKDSVPVMVQEIKEAQENIQEFHKSKSYLDLFKGPNLVRTIVSVGVPCLLYGQGRSFMASYLVQFLIAVGLSDTYLILVIVMVVLLVSTASSILFIDRFSRRHLLSITALFMGGFFYCIAGISYYGPSTDSMHNLILAFLLLWCVIYAAVWAPMVYIVAGEIPNSQLREKTVSLTAFMVYAIHMTISFVNPFLQDEGYGNLQGRVGFVYGSFSFVSVVFVYFLVPDVRNLLLDVIDTLYELKVSVFKFQKEGRIIATEKRYLELDKELSGVKSNEELEILRSKISDEKGRNGARVQIVSLN